MTAEAINQDAYLWGVLAYFLCFCYLVTLLRSSFKLLKLVRRALLGIVFLSGSTLAMTLEKETALGVTAGEYYAAVVMNEEFKRSKCGAYLQIPIVWSDSAYAMHDIQWNIPDNVRDKAKVIQSMPNQVRSLRLEIQRDTAQLNESQCKVMAKRIYNITTPPIIKWNDMK